MEGRQAPYSRLCLRPEAALLTSILAASGPNPHSFWAPVSAAQVTFQKTLEEEAKGAVSDIPVPKFKQKKRESDQAYVQRMEQEAQHVIFLSRNQPSCQPEAPVDSREKSERKKA